MPIGISSGDEKRRILEREPERINEDIMEKANALGINSIQSLKPEKNKFQQLKEINEYGNMMSEGLLKEKELREHRTRERQRNYHTPFKVGLRRFLEMQEIKSKEEYDKRRVVFADGGIAELEERLKMLPYRVLVRVLPSNSNVSDNDLIVAPDCHIEKNPRCVVLCVGEGVDDVEKGDVVIVDTYAGVEVVSKKVVYRILMDTDLLCKVEKNED
jgi:co-chaperonin GroES (HSP10)